MMRDNFIILFGVFLFTFSTIAFAQDNFVVRGKILDDVTGEPIIGATIVEVGADNRFLNGTISDFNGDFQLQVTDAGATIKISFIGYVEQSIQIDGNAYFTVRIKEDVKQLAEATVVATRTQSDGLVEIAERNLTSATVSVDLQDMTEVAATSAEEALQGQVSGVDIIMNSGDPGSGSTIVIRGMSSFSSDNQPLFVLDGIPQRLKAGDDFEFGSADVEDIGELVSVPPSIIKSINVLKDAAATAPYGSEGANGVIVIETLKGKKGPAQFSYTFKYNLNEQPPPIPMLNGDEYTTLQFEQLFNVRGIYDVPDQLANDPNYRDFYNYGKNTDWVGAVNQSSVSKEHSLTVGGGGAKTRYFASVNFLDEVGTAIETDFNRFSTNARVTYDVSDRLVFDLDFAFANNSRNSTPEFNKKNTRAMAYIKMPSMSILEYDQNNVPTGNYFTPIDNYQGDALDFFNPVALAKLGVQRQDENNISTSFTLNYKIYKEIIKFRGIVSYMYQNSKASTFGPYNALGTDWLNVNNNYAINSSTDRTQLLLRGQLFYNQAITNDHLVNSAISWDVRENATQGFTSEASKTASVFITDPAATAVFSKINNNIGLSRKISARYYVNYTLKDRYIANVNFAFEGSTKFGLNERWGFFPSGSLAWRIGSEPLLQSQEYWLGKETKLRFSYGIAGSEGGIGNYSRHSTYNIAGTYIFNPVVVPSGVQLDNLKWETSSSYNIGLDAFMFRNKLDISAEYYKRNTTDIIWKDYNLATSSGYGQLEFFNGGEVENKGWELQWRYQILRARDWTISVNGNFANNQNSFLSFPDNFETEKDPNIKNGGYPRRVSVGNPIGSFYGVRYLGVYASDEDAFAYGPDGNMIYDLAGNPLPLSYNNSPGFIFRGGDAMYEDINKDGTINSLDAIYLGNSNPDLIGGLGASVRYKSFTFKADLFSRWNYQIVNMTAMNTQSMSNKLNQSKAVLYRWRREGMDFPGIIPRAVEGHQFNNLGSDRYVEDGNFVRLNNVSLIYEVPKSICNKLNVNKIDLRFNGRKLATWTNYTGQDPEVSIKGGDPFFMGADNARTPVARRYSFSVVVRF